MLHLNPKQTLHFPIRLGYLDPPAMAALERSAAFIISCPRRRAWAINRVVEDVRKDHRQPQFQKTQSAARDFAFVAMASEAKWRMTQHADSTAADGTHRSVTETERKRRYRARRRAAILFSRDDWQLFLDPATLPQKAGCQPEMLRRIILRELVDNGLDAGANVTLEGNGENAWIVADDGPGIAPAEVPRLFAVNRPLLSSKRRRLPLRGMLGNGLRVVMGGVAASGGEITVSTRGRRLCLTVDHSTGATQVIESAKRERVGKARAQQHTNGAERGLVVHLAFGPDLPRHDDDDHADDDLARASIMAAEHGSNYTGPSSPWWYGPRDLHALLLQVVPATTTVGELIGELGFNIDDNRPARSLNLHDADVLLRRLRKAQRPIPTQRLGQIGPTLRPDACYARKSDTARLRGGAEIPFVVEAWATCTKPEQKSDRRPAGIRLLLNRTPSAANILAASFSDQFAFQGCGLRRHIFGMRGGNYDITLSVIAPHIDLATDGKEPALGSFSDSDHRGYQESGQRGAPDHAAAETRVQYPRCRMACDEGCLCCGEWGRTLSGERAADHVCCAPDGPRTDAARRARRSIFHANTAARLSHRAPGRDRRLGRRV
jgi:hypothetical protein